MHVLYMLADAETLRIRNFLKSMEMWLELGVIPLHVISSNSKTILLGTDWIDKYKADIMGSSKRLRFVKPLK